VDESRLATLAAIAAEIQGPQPSGGRGWRACVMEDRQVAVEFTFRDYDQVMRFKAELRAFGYEMTLLDRRAEDCDFLFSVPHGRDDLVR
jgi:hypothetical protein